MITETINKFFNEIYAICSNFQFQVVEHYLNEPKTVIFILKKGVKLICDDITKLGELATNNDCNFIITYSDDGELCFSFSDGLLN